MVRSVDGWRRGARLLAVVALAAAAAVHGAQEASLPLTVAGEQQQQAVGSRTGEGAEVLEGLVSGFLDAAVPDLRACAAGEQRVAQDVAAAVSALRGGAADDVQRALSALSADVSLAVAPCEQEGAEVGDLQRALAELQHPLAFAFVAGEHLVVNHVAIFDQLSDAAARYDAGDWTGLGRDLGRALELLSVGRDAREALRAPFTAWAAAHARAYAAAGDAAEFERRLAAYAANAAAAAQLRAADAGARYDVDASPFADMSAEEFAASGRVMAQKLPLRAGELARSCLENGALAPPPEALRAPPAAFDWRDRGVVAPVRDQRQCGSCWAFSTAENIEALWAIAGHPLTVLSPQDIVDCSHSCAPEGPYGNVCNSGCMGGWPWSAYLDLIELGGIAAEADYPYTGAAGACAFRGRDEAAVRLANYTCLPSDEAAIAAFLVANGPVSVALDARFLQLYTGGVHDPPMCSQTMLDHAVLLVGYGTDADSGKDYWLVKNSWTDKWGEAGFFRIVRGTNACGIANAASSAILRVQAAPLGPSGHRPRAPPPRRAAGTEALVLDAGAAALGAGSAAVAR